jgi:penicillin G amidase
VVLKRILQYFNIAVLIALILLVAAVYWYAWRPLPQTSGALDAPVSKPVSIARDALGVPHISAASVEDALFAQGFATAQDRLWQMEGLRRLAAGRLAEILGPGFIERDREARRYRLARIAEQHARDLPQTEGAQLAVYARGVNHFIETHRDRLPLEFKLLGFEPQPWTVRDSVLVGLLLYRELTTTWRDKLVKSAMLAGGDPAKVAILFPARLGGEVQPGSNAWVLAGSHTATGKPLLANDPHLESSNPGIWFMVHLRAPGLDVAGVALPGLPGVILGHNDRIAWGATNLGFDVQELYIEKLDPRTGRYLFRGQIEQARLERELIPVKGARPVEFAQWVTRHGPVLFEGGRALALRWTAAEPGGFSFPLIDIDRARNWQEFTAALARYPGPGQNFVYADTEGNIGYHATGRLPIRACEGDIPVDGSSGKCEWNGYIPFEKLPQAYNPPTGIFVSANDNPFPPDYAYSVRGNFAARFRADRIRQILGSRGKWTANDMLQIQTDVYSAFAHHLAREILEACDRRRSSDPEIAAATAALRSWNGQMDNGTAPLIATLAYQHLRRAIAERASPKNAILYQSSEHSGAAYFAAPAVIENLLRTKPRDWFSDWGQVLVRALTDALAEGRRIQGRNLSKWDYGAYNQLFLPNPVIGNLRLVGSYFNMGPVPQSGSPVTVKQTTRRLGPSMRTAADLSDLDNSYMNITLGESGHVLSKHYRDQWKAYYEGRSFPMQFHRVDAKSTLMLEPAAN